MKGIRRAASREHSIPGAHWPNSLLSSSDVNEEACTELADPRFGTSTSSISKHFHFTLPFCLFHLLIAVEQQGCLHVPSSRKCNRSKMLCVAGEKSSTSSLNTGLCTEDKDEGAQSWCTIPAAVQSGTAENLGNAVHWALLKGGGPMICRASGEI